jgi:DNA-binding NtrC family response regulator
MSNRHGILVVDDEFSVRDSLTKWLTEEGYRVDAAESAVEALKKFKAGAWDVVLLDIKMPGMDGLEFQKRIRELDPDLIVIMITAYASVNTAVQALKNGAFDYVAKPFDPDELCHLIKKALRQKELTEENVRLRERVEHLAGSAEIIGDSEAMKRVLELADTVAETDATVLIRGESGTGKELIAKAIHSRSDRRYFSLVPINCGALPENLLETELFGHERGAFTGAQYHRKGKLEMADGGTLFLDEIGTISMKTQLDLLRVLETKEFSRLGSDKLKKVDFRVVCATNQNLEQAVADGGFREDFYYRINVFAIHLPPLREREGDIPLLARHFARKYSNAMGKELPEITAGAMKLLASHSWPGNVRELQNAMERAMVVAQDGLIRPADLPFQNAFINKKASGDSLAEMESHHILAVLERCQWNISHSARALKIDRATLYNKMKKYNLRS